MNDEYDPHEAASQDKPQETRSEPVTTEGEWSESRLDMLFEQARSGQAQAFLELGKIFQGTGQTGDAMKYFTEAIQLGELSAAYNLGLLQMEGENYEAAAQSFLVGANRNDSRSMRNLGLVWQRLGEEDLAADWFRRAASLGSSSARTLYANYLSRKSSNGGLPILRDAAESGDSVAMYQLAHHDLAQQDFQGCASWLTKAIDAGYLAAQRELDVLLAAQPSLAEHVRSDALLTAAAGSHVGTKVGQGRPRGDTQNFADVGGRTPGRSLGPDKREPAASNIEAPNHRGFVASSPRVPRWQRAYIHKIVAIDALSAAFGAFVAFFLQYNEAPADLTTLPGRSAVLLAVLMPGIWVLFMGSFRTYEPRFLGVGAEEYRRVLTSAASLTTLVGVASWMFSLDIARGYVAVALPLATLLTVVGRLTTRRSLHKARTRGEAGQSVLAVGHRSAVAGMAQQMHRASSHGMRVVAACVPGGAGSPEDDAELRALGVPVVGSLEDIVDVTKALDADIVAITSCPELDGSALRRLGWDLESTRADLVVAPALTEIVGPRVVIRPISGLPLLHVERPELVGARRLLKGAVDRTWAAVTLLILSPLLLVIALLIKLGSRGPVFFRQQRVGKDGQTFSMYKFRTMITDTERSLVDFQAPGDSARIMFKLRRDPRITRIGSFLRRYSLDELPQLLNVINGSMSLVGPRPPMERELANYGEDMRRRLLVKPGLTGLWQISGRSDLDWDESVRLDLRYVENWSFTFDFMILWKTASAVVRGH